MLKFSLESTDFPKCVCGSGIVEVGSSHGVSLFFWSTMPVVIRAEMYQTVKLQYSLSSPAYCPHAVGSLLSPCLPEKLILQYNQMV